MNETVVGRARWVRRGETVHVNGYALFTGMFYLGRTFGDPNTAYDDYILDPRLPFGPSARGHVPMAGFVPVYGDMQPGERRAYLEWLSGSCRDTSVRPGFLQFYMCGLYYRVFVERGDDREVVLNEARRLLNLYSGNFHSASVCASLLTFASAMDCEKGMRPVPRPYWDRTPHVSAEVLVRIGHVLSEGMNLDAEDALLWAMERCKAGHKPGEIDHAGMKVLWARKFRERYPQGARGDVTSKRLRIEYASPDGVNRFRVPVPAWAERLPDPRECLGMNAQLEQLYEECAHDLKAYARLVARKPQAAGTLEAVNALPKQLVASSLAGRFSNVKEALDKVIAQQGVVAPKTAALFQIMDLKVSGDDALSAGLRKLIGTALDKMDIAFEPDARYGSAQFSLAGHVVFFRGRDGLPVVDRPVYAAYRTLSEFLLGQFAASAAEAERLETALFARRAAEPGLGDDDRTRLAAHARHLVVNHGTGKQPSVKKERLDEREIEKIGRLVLAIVPSSLDKAKFAAVEKFFRKLGLPVEDIHRDLHRAAIARGDGLVSVIPAQPAGGVPISPRPKPAPAPVAPPSVSAPVVTPPAEASRPAIDFAKLGEIEADTALVSGLLFDIFADEAVPLAPSVGTPATSRPGGFEGLDGPHSEILAAVMAAGTMAPRDFEVLARSFATLPSAALEVINEWAFEVFGEIAVVDNGGISLEEHLRTELEEMRTPS